MKRSTSLDQPRPVVRTQVLSLALGVLLPLLAGCPGSLEGNFPPLNGTGGSTGTGGMPGTGGGAAVCDAPATVFGTTCFFCHGSGGVPSLPDLTTAPIEANLIGVNSVSGMCLGQPFINRANPSASVIIKRVSGNSCGMLMPLGAGSPDQAIIDCVTSWVMSKVQ